MKGSVVQFVFILLALVFGGALESVLPSVWGLSVPVLLGAAVFFATVTRAPVWIFAAVAAGALEESVASLPPATAIVFFAALAVAVRFLPERIVWIVAAYPAYQIWLGLVAEGSGAIARAMVAVPVGALSLAAVAALMSVAWRKAGADA